MKYMIIDDEINASNLLKRILENYDGLSGDDEIIVYNDSLKAWDHIRKSPPDLIFQDIEMPKMTGEELARKITEEITPRPFIIFITAFPQYSMFAWDTGAVGYILKPYSARSVYEAIEKYRKLSASTGQHEETYAKKPFIRCFPDFELLVDDEPVFFKNKKSKGHKRVNSNNNRSKNNNINFNEKYYETEHRVKYKRKQFNDSKKKYK